jgi:cytochrome c-type biogenesis protein CcmH/NrfG
VVGEPVALVGGQFVRAEASEQLLVVDVRARDGVRRYRVGFVLIVVVCCHPCVVVGTWLVVGKQCGTGENGVSHAPDPSE